jgi:hypothetical protein
MSADREHLTAVERNNRLGFALVAESHMLITGNQKHSIDPSAQRERIINVALGDRHTWQFYQSYQGDGAFIHWANGLSDAEQQAVMERMIKRTQLFGALDALGLWDSLVLDDPRAREAAREELRRQYRTEVWLREALREDAPEVARQIERDLERQGYCLVCWAKKTACRHAKK